MEQRKKVKSDARRPSRELTGLKVPAANVLVTMVFMLPLPAAWSVVWDTTTETRDGLISNPSAKAALNLGMFPLASAQTEACWEFFCVKKDQTVMHIQFHANVCSADRRT